jgi:DNA repair exonuclease SbcCD ATPase subunit
METIEREEIYRIAREVARQEFESVFPIYREIDDLKSTVKELVEAQVKSEERLSRLEIAVEELTRAQIKSEERLARVETAIEKLAEAQARTEARLEELAQAQAKAEERLTRLEETVEKLAEAQARTEARLEELAQAQAKAEERLTRLEETVEKLAEAQARTEKRLEELIIVVGEMQKEIRSINQQLGGLAHAVGFQLEDKAYISLPALLQRDFGIKIKERLVRKNIRPSKGELIEINIIGKAEKDGQEIYVIGEAKANLSIKHIVDFIDRLRDIRETLQKEVFPILVTYMTDPETEEYAKSKNITVYYSYEFQPIL